MLRSFEEEGKGKYRWLNGVQVPGWCETYTRGCPVRSGVIVAGSSEGLNRPRVELLDVPKIDQKQLPDLILPSALVAMAWDSADNSLVVVGGVKYEKPCALATRKMFRLTKVDGDGSVWEKLRCKLPSALVRGTINTNNFELLLSDSHLYLLGCGDNHKGAKRILMDKLEKLQPDSKAVATDWEDLEELKSEIKSHDGKGGAVFIQGKVIVFTLHHIMTLDLESQPPKWITIKDTHFENCIPRKLNDNIILVLVNRKNDNDIQENVMEMYDVNNSTWKPWEPSVSDLDDHKKLIEEASWDHPWKFFVMHTDAASQEHPVGANVDDINLDVNQ